MQTSNITKEFKYSDIANLELKDKEKLQTLMSATSIMLSDINIEEIYQKAVDLLVEHFGYTTGVIFVNRSVEKKIYSYTYSNLEGNHLSLSNLNRAFRSLSVDYSTTTNAIVRCITEQKVIEGTSLIDFACPAVNKELAQLIQAVSGTKIMIALPMINKNNVLGALMIGKKTTENFVHDYNFLVVFTKQLSIAIAHAEEYAKQKDENLIKLMTEEIKGLYKSYNISTESKDVKPEAPNPF